LAKLPDFVGGAVDFGALASATNFSKMLKQDGYSHIEGLMEKNDLEGLAELGVTSQSVRRSIRNFMKLFWVKFGWAEAHSMAKARHAAVGLFLLAILGL
jgi:hypothetical protein